MRLFPKKTKLAFLIFLLACSSGPEFGGDGNTNGSNLSESDLDSAETPTAVAGGLYLLDCQQNKVDALQADCSLNNRGEKVSLKDRFSYVDLKVKPPQGVSHSIRSYNEGENHHWSVSFSSENSNLLAAEIHDQSQIAIEAELKDGSNRINVSTFSKRAAKPSIFDAKKIADTIGIEHREVAGQPYFKSRKGSKDSCAQTCSLIGLEVDIEAGYRDNEHDRCKEIWKKFNTVRLVWLPDNFFVRKDLNRSDIRSLGCGYGKLKSRPDKIHFITNDYNPRARIPDDAEGELVCRCR